MLQPRTYTLIAIIFAVVIFRFLPHPPNVSPVLAISLFAGATFTDRRLMFIVPLLAMLLSDLVLGMHDTMVYVYAALGLSVMMGMWLQSRRSVVLVTGVTLGASLMFFIVTNFGVWLSGIHQYPMDAQGLMQSYVAGIPFLQNSILGNLFFTALIFGSYELIKRYQPSLVKA